MTIAVRRRPAVLAALALTAASLVVGLVGPSSAGAVPAPESARAAAVAPTASLAPTAIDPASMRVTLRPFLRGLTQPVLVTSTPGDRSGRLYVVEKAGRIRLISGGRIAGTYLDIRSIVSSTGERGLLGLAFAPDFATSHYFFVTYTRSDGALVLARYHAASATSTVVSPATRVQVLVVPHPTYANHNGGYVAFGRDGYLYLGTGDGGGGGDPFRNAQRLSSLSGKILRIDERCNGRVYCIPSTNPYARSTTAKREIWMSGVRNPWRWSFDTDGTIWVADVGQNRYEEVTFLSARSQRGSNLGWSCWEGTVHYATNRCISGALYRIPQITYCHPGNVTPCSGDLSGNSITGGFVYRGAGYPSAQGMYVFADFVAGKLWGYRGGAYTPSTAVPGITGFGLSDTSEMWAVTIDGGLYRVGFTAVA